MLLGLTKRDFIVEKKKKFNTESVFYKPLPFYATQLISPFFNSRILANHDKVDGLSANCETIIKYNKSLSYPLLFCYATQIISPFLNSRISANHDVVEGQNVEILIMGFETLL